MYGREAEYLYPGVDISLKDASLVLTKYFVDNNISSDALDETIDMIQLFIPFKENKDKFDVSASKLKNYFQNPQDINMEYFCRNCKKILDNKDLNCRSCKQSTTGEFIHMKVESQIRTLFSRDDIREKIIKRDTRIDETSSIRSLKDGKVYKEMGVFLSNPNNFSMSLYTDGVDVCNSAKLSVWPIYLHINELPRSVRYKIENTMLLGLWYDKIKPNFNTFLQPCVEFFKSLRLRGLDIDYVSNKKLISINVKAVVISAFADAPAKASELNLKQYNGYYGCNTCIQTPVALEPLIKAGNQKLVTEDEVETTEWVEVETTTIIETNETTSTPTDQVVGKKKGSKRKGEDKSDEASSSKKPKKSTLLVYKYQKGITLRTTSATKLLAYEAERTGIEQMGVKGLTLLYFIIPNVIEGFGINPMHCVFSGVVKKMMELWFDKRHRKRIFSMHNKVKEVDKLMLSIKPPNFITRRPKPIETQFSYFTTAEFKNFCLYYSIPILKKIGMEIARFHHYALFVDAIYILHKDEITYADLVTATNFLDKFVANFAFFYGIEFMSYNVHALLHLGECVRNLGPLFESSCFPLEALNGIIKAWIKGSRYAHLKILNFLNYAQTLPLHIQELPKNSSAMILIEKWSNKKKERILQTIDQRSNALGCSYLDCSELRWQKLKSAQNSVGILTNCVGKDDVKIFLRLRRNKILYSSRANKATKRTVSYCIEYGSNSKIGLVEFFFKANNCDCETVCSCSATKYFALVKQCDKVTIDPEFRPDFSGKKISKLLTYEIISISDINDICVLCALDVDNYFCTRKVNSKEIE